MAKSRTLRFVEYLERYSYGMISVWPAGNNVEARYRNGKLRADYQIEEFIIEQSKLSPEVLAEEVLCKLLRTEGV